ncbi:Kiwa anti-phage protein KwaB-like domain-containing protein [Solibacillus daqui]|uniref:Kiwa anti-phage protein KwaB-like domain-containing protein n=1 Tax=Solibacillus daqui TaxID=2912187 RepID=UPI002366DE80|nr:Kiwa anti-phage protein KwaB-like domain-containing protein [Solibacillus daqui]
MDILGLRQFFRDFNVDTGNISVKLVQKIDQEYEVYEPIVRNRLQRDLKELYVEVLQTRLFGLPQEEYNPNVGQDGYLSVAPLYVAHVDETIEKLESEENIHGDMNEMNLDDINFYCVTFTRNGESVYIFRRFTKMKKIRRGISTFIEDNTLRKFDNDLFIGLDRDIDILVYQGEMLIVNRFALQTIFNLQDYFTTRATEALDHIENGNVISNFEEFREDCLNDRQASKRITKIINTPGRIEGFLANANLLPNVIEEAALEIELNEDGQIIYTRNRQVRSEILFCIADAYYLSLLLNRIGEDISQ